MKAVNIKSPCFFTGTRTYPDGTVVTLNDIQIDGLEGFKTVHLNINGSYEDVLSAISSGSARQLYIDQVVPNARIVWNSYDTVLLNGNIATGDYWLTDQSVGTVGGTGLDGSTYFGELKFTQGIGGIDL